MKRLLGLAALSVVALWAQDDSTTQKAAKQVEEGAGEANKALE